MASGSSSSSTSPGPATASPPPGDPSGSAARTSSPCAVGSVAGSSVPDVSRATTSISPWRRPTSPCSLSTSLPSRSLSWRSSLFSASRPEASVPVEPPQPASTKAAASRTTGRPPVRTVRLAFLFRSAPKPCLPPVSYHPYLNKPAAPGATFEAPAGPSR